MARRVQLPFAPRQCVGAHRTALPDLAALPPERVAVVRYEAFTTAPEAALRELWYRCGLRTTGADVAAALHHARSLFETPDERWSRLPRWQQRYILRIISELQEELGYPLAEGFEHP